MKSRVISDLKELQEHCRKAVDLLHELQELEPNESTRCFEYMLTDIFTLFTFISSNYKDVTRYDVICATLNVNNHKQEMKKLIEQLDR